MSVRRSISRSVRPVELFFSSFQFFSSSIFSLSHSFISLSSLFHLSFISLSSLFHLSFISLSSLSFHSLYYLLPLLSLLFPSSLFLCLSIFLQSHYFKLSNVTEHLESRSGQKASEVDVVTEVFSFCFLLYFLEERHFILRIIGSHVHLFCSYP